MRSDFCLILIKGFSLVAFRLLLDLIMGKAARNKALKADKKKEVVMGNEKMQLKTADKCAKLAPRRSFAKKAKEVKLNLKKVTLPFSSGLFVKAQGFFPVGF